MDPLFKHKDSPIQQEIINIYRWLTQLVGRVGLIETYGSSPKPDIVQLKIDSAPPLGALPGWLWYSPKTGEWRGFNGSKWDLLFPQWWNYVDVIPESSASDPGASFPLRQSQLWISTDEPVGAEFGWLWVDPEQNRIMIYNGTKWDQLFPAVPGGQRADPTKPTGGGLTGLLVPLSVSPNAPQSPADGTVWLDPTGPKWTLLEGNDLMQLFPWVYPGRLNIQFVQNGEPVGGNPPRSGIILLGYSNLGTMPPGVKEIPFGTEPDIQITNMPVGNYTIGVSGLPDGYSVESVDPPSITIVDDTQNTSVVTLKYTFPIFGSQWEAVFDSGAPYDRVTLAWSGDYIYAGFENTKIAFANINNLRNWQWCTVPWSTSSARRIHVNINGGHCVACLEDAVDQWWAKAPIGSDVFTKIWSGFPGAGRTYSSMRGIDANYIAQILFWYGSPRISVLRVSDAGTHRNDPLTYDGNRQFVVRPNGELILSSYHSTNTAKIYRSPNIINTNLALVYDSGIPSTDSSAIDFANGEYVALVGSTNQQSPGLLRSSDGVNWTNFGTNLPPISSYPAVFCFKILNRSAPNTAGLAIRSDGVYRSIDGFQTWQKVLDVTTTIGSYADCIVLPDGRIVMGHAKRIYLSES